MYITIQDKEKINAWNNTVSEPVELTLILSGDENSGVLSTFCDELSRAASNISIKIKKDEDEAHSFLKVRENILYYATPVGPELPPFLTLLSFETKGGPKENVSELSCLELPVHADVFIAPGCPHCPRAVSQMMEIALAAPENLVKLSVIDGVLFSDISAKYNVQSAPTVLLDETFRFSGTINKNEIVRVMVDRDPSKLGEKTLEGMIKEGEASKVAEMMLMKHMLFPAFLNLLMHDKWSVRLGAMVAMEEIIEKDVSLASGLSSSVIENFDRMSIQSRGDMIYLLGECAPKSILPFLEDIMKKEGKETDFGETVKEAMERIHERQGNLKESSA